MNQGQRIKNLNMNGYQQFNNLIIINLYSKNCLSLNPAFSLEKSI